MYANILEKNQTMQLPTEKEDWGFSSVVECLTNIEVALGSIPSR
jgi:hypothetical protein